jgi:hypothetical protein
MSASKNVKIQNTTYSSIAPYPPLEVGTAVIGRVVVLPKRYPSLLHTQLLLLVLSCVTILQQQAKHWRLSRCSFQLNNKQSINLITSLCWSYFSKTKLLPGYTYYTLSKISKLFLAALQVTEITASLLTAQADRTNEPLPCTTTHHYHR